MSKAWVSALNTVRVLQSGTWWESLFRYAETACLETEDNGAALTFEFTGEGVALGLGQHAVSAYGRPSLGKLIVTMDDGSPRILYPGNEAREVVLARGLTLGKHRVRVEHLQNRGETGCRISGFRVLTEHSGELAFVLNGEENGFFVDARAVIRQGNQIVRNTLVRNWLSGTCRLTGLPAGKGYSLELIAYGWASQKIEEIAIQKGKETRLPPVYLHRNPETRPQGFRFPVLGHPTICRPKEFFRVRLGAYDHTIGQVKLSRRIGPATISRTVAFEEDPSAKFYYDREGTISLPQDIPPGLYDLSIRVSGSRGDFTRQSPRSVYVVRDYPKDPVFMTFGHLDTQGQYQAEYERQLAEVANLIAPDMVLISNAVNPAYISGSHLVLEMPYAITFGNHQFYGHEKWYGDQVGIIDYGPNLCILNFGHPWHVDLSQANALLSSRAKAKIKIINAFEHNAPVETFLDRHKVKLIHDAHGPGEKVMTIGATPTTRVGKSNSSSFRVVRFKDGHVTSATYRGDAVAPIPFDRAGPPPLSVTYDPGNDGKHDKVTATVTNMLEDAFPDCRVIFVLPAGTYAVDGGRLETMVTSDDERYIVLTVRVDVPAEGTARATAWKKE
ncbi:MAG: hypothetical protein OXI94_15215 [Gemmatimonadota bacterium]|nr:hypothetical protein [Gemmatimonadota bacterium]